ncbi:hypothetical protein Goari_006444, partial [Gossypium aridum]|nr:hypothetical protein [Gossypium aridum]
MSKPTRLMSSTAHRFWLKRGAFYWAVLVHADQEFVTLLFGRESVGNNGGRGRRRALPPLLRGAKRKIRPRVFELEFKPDGKLCYANNSNYKNDTMIRKEVFLIPAVLKECRRII